ncbi:MAG: GNAT family N-acetyltransferase [Candidatus Dormibacteria bacterium]
MLVRAATSPDAGGIQAIYAPVVEATTISFEEVAPDRAEITRRMLTAPRLPWFVAEDQGRIAGYAYASRHAQRAGYRWSADCSIYLDNGHRSRGLGRLLYERLIAEVQGLGYATVIAGITLPNEPSVRLHAAMGFRPVGICRKVGYKHGSWHDVSWWQRQLGELPSPPPEPREWTPPAM